jgi:hypothetical protein
VATLQLGEGGDAVPCRREVESLEEPAPCQLVVARAGVVDDNDPEGRVGEHEGSADADRSMPEDRATADRRGHAVRLGRWL